MTKNEQRLIRELANANSNKSEALSTVFDMAGKPQSEKATARIQYQSASREVSRIEAELEIERAKAKTLIGAIMNFLGIG